MSSAVEARISGVEKLLAKLGGNIQNVVFTTIGGELTDAAIMVHSEAVKSIQDHLSSGISRTSYFRFIKKSNSLVRRKRPIEHVASAPGYPPNSDIGTLARSIHFEIDQAELTAVVGTNLKYGAFLELGTTSIQPRPWLFPAFEAHRDEIKANLQRAIREAVRGAGA